MENNDHNDNNFDNHNHSVDINFHYHNNYEKELNEIGKWPGTRQNENNFKITI